MLMLERVIIKFFSWHVVMPCPLLLLLRTLLVLGIMKILEQNYKKASQTDGVTVVGVS
jgi:hypothetical protein